MQTLSRIKEYVSDWKDKGYSDDIPDEVPHALEKLNLAPSYKAICLALLRNDLNLEALGFAAKKSKWYSILKGIEIAARPKKD